MRSYLDLPSLILLELRMPMYAGTCDSFSRTSCWVSFCLGRGCSTHATLVGPPLPVYVDEVDRFVSTWFGALIVLAIVGWFRPTTPAPCR